MTTALESDIIIHHNTSYHGDLDSIYIAWVTSYTSHFTSPEPRRSRLPPATACTLGIRELTPTTLCSSCMTIVFPGSDKVAGK